MLGSVNNATHILEILESEMAYIPGGRDRAGRPLIVINVPPGELHPSIKSNLETVLKYFLSIFSDETKETGLCLLIDIRGVPWRVARTYIRLSMLVIDSQTASIIAIRSDGFWDFDNCTKIHKPGDPVYIPLNRLNFYVENSQLPYNLEGNKAYNHSLWTQHRVKIEGFIDEALQLITRMTELYEQMPTHEQISAKDSRKIIYSYLESSRTLSTTASCLLSSGRKLVSDMCRETAQDVLDTMQKLHKTLDRVQIKQVEIENTWLEMQKHLDIIKEIETIEEGISRVTNWILGFAESTLNSNYQIGYDVSSAEELRREHEKLELKCIETYGLYAELIHKIDKVPSSSISEDLKSQKEFMDFVCRNFAARLERRRHALLTSLKFFHLISEYFDKTSDVFDKLVMGHRTDNFIIAETKLYELEKSQKMLNDLERDLVQTGESLTDLLSVPIKDALCRDFLIDYSEDIINVYDILDATNARKNIFNDSVELQKLTLKQITLINSYESDASEAIKWLKDLLDVLIENHMEIGSTIAEIRSQKEDHQSFQETAKNTYEYGWQLINGARILRVSCKLPLEQNINLLASLRKSWIQLYTIGQEQLTRLRVCAVFHRNVEDFCKTLCNLVESMESVLTKQSSKNEHDLRSVIEVIKDVLDKREKLLPEVGRMVRLGRLLRSRLKEPLNHQRMSDSQSVNPDNNSAAIESISAKLLEVTRLAEKLDNKLFEAGARDQTSDSAIGHKADRMEDFDGVDSIRRTIGEESKKDQNDKDINEKNTTATVIEDSNTEEYVTATECSTTPMTRSRSESLLTSSEYEDALGISASGLQLLGQMSKSTDCLSDVKNVDEISKDVIKSTSPQNNELLDHNDNTITNEDNQKTVIHNSFEEKKTNFVKEVTETTTLRVSHNTHLGVESYKLVSNTLKENQTTGNLKVIEDSNYVIKRETNAINDCQTTPSENINDIDKGKIEQESHHNGNAVDDFNSDLKSPWLISREERNYHSFLKDSPNSSTVFHKYVRTNIRDINSPPPIAEEQTNGIADNAEITDETVIVKSKNLVSVVDETDNRKSE